MHQTEPTFTPADLTALIDLMHRALAKLDEFALSVPASYVQLAIDHVREAAGA